MSDNGKTNAGDLARHKDRDAVDTPVMTAEPCLIEDVDRTDDKDAFPFGMQGI